MATIQDVAKTAGVAASTVSRYLNGQLRVTPATEARLLDAVATLGYVANVQARNLARRRSGAIGFVVPEMSNPYFGAIADHVVEAVERRGLMVLLCSTRSQAVKESSYIDLLASGAIDGMLYLGSFRSNVRLAAAIHGGLPVVVVDEPIAGLPEVHSVVMDDYSGGYQAASYLVAVGHPQTPVAPQPIQLGSVETQQHRVATRAPAWPGTPPSISGPARCPDGSRRRTRPPRRSWPATTSHWACCPRRRRTASGCPRTCP